MKTLLTMIAALLLLVAAVMSFGNIYDGVADSFDFAILGAFLTGISKVLK
jgi:hypothetical protein